MIKQLSFLTALSLLSTPLLAAEKAGQWTLSTGATYTSGDYDSPYTSEFYYLPVSLKYKIDKWSFKLTVPYLKMKGPQNVIREIGQVSRTVTVPNQTSQGLGDIIFSGSYQFLYLPKIKTVFDIKGKVKFGTADEDKSLGTGKNDYTIQAGAYKLMGKFTPYITLGHRFYGESSSTQLDNVFLGTLGLMYKATDDINVGLDFYAKQKTASHRNSTQQLTAYSTVKFDKNWKLQSYLIKGISDNTPDYGLGFSLGYQFD